MHSQVQGLKAGRFQARVELAPPYLAVRSLLLRVILLTVRSFIILERAPTFLLLRLGALAVLGGRRRQLGDLLRGEVAGVLQPQCSVVCVCKLRNKGSS